MKLCLYNVENLFLLNHGLNDNYKKPVEKVEWIARTIKEINPDIAMLCEVGGLESLDYFNSHYLNDRYTTVLSPGNSDRGIEMGYLINKNLPLTHFLISHKDRPINFNYPHEINEFMYKKIPLPVHKFSRDIAELRLFDKNKKIHALIFLVHLKSKLDKDGIDFNGKLRRKAELETLIAVYKKRCVEFPDCPIIVAGDFNGLAQKFSFEPEFAKLYTETDLEDILEVINEPLENRYTYFYFNKDLVREASQLDYIMLPPKLHSLVKKEESGIYHYRDSSGIRLPTPQDSFQRYALPSDHYPLVATFKI